MIKFDHVTKVYKGSIEAVKEVTFTVDDGEFFFVVGPSGAGKSTLVRLLVRQEIPSEGDIIFGDIDITQIPRKLLSLYRQQLGIVFQDLKLLSSKTIRENISFALEITSHPKSEIDDVTDYLLEKVNLKSRADLYPVDLSGGEQQKAAIARALANDPKLLIADEPTGNLDPATASEIVDILKRINDSGTTIMAITHDKNIVNELQARVIHMKEGRIISDKVGGYDA